MVYNPMLSQSPEPCIKIKEGCYYPKLPSDFPKSGVTHTVPFSILTCTHVHTQIYTYVTHIYTFTHKCSNPKPHPKLSKFLYSLKRQALLEEFPLDDVTFLL